MSSLTTPAGIEALVGANEAMGGSPAENAIGQAIATAAGMGMLDREVKPDVQNNSKRD